MSNNNSENNNSNEAYQAQPPTPKKGFKNWSKKKKIVFFVIIAIVAVGVIGAILGGSSGGEEEYSIDGKYYFSETSTVLGITIKTTQTIELNTENNSIEYITKTNDETLTKTGTFEIIYEFPEEVLNELNSDSDDDKDIIKSYRISVELENEYYVIGFEPYLVVTVFEDGSASIMTYETSESPSTFFDRD